MVSEAEGQAQPARKILFLAGPHSHGPGEHEHPGGSLLLADALNKSGLGVWAQVHNGWPSYPSAFTGVSAVVIYCDGEESHLAKGRFLILDSLNRSGVGISFLHYALVVAKGTEGNHVLNWLGGYYETYWSVNPFWTAKFTSLPAHPSARGVQPFTIMDEWYFHMRFRTGMQGVTPLLSAHPPKETIMGQPDSPHGSNPDARADVGAGIIQHVAWVAENPGRGRGFGFTGGHTHANWGNPNLLKAVLNALLWTASGEVPAAGVPFPVLGSKELQTYLDAKVPPLVSWGPTALRAPLQASRGRGNGAAGFSTDRANPANRVINAKGQALPLEAAVGSSHVLNSP